MIKKSLLDFLREQREGQASGPLETIRRLNREKQKFQDRPRVVTAGRNRQREVEITPETRAVLSILVREIREILDGYSPEEAVPKVRELLDSWVKGSGLYPEEVEAYHPKGDE